jgi:hypothetical protein
MTREEALEIVLAAASRWLSELNDYIIPGADEAETASYQTEADDLDEALDVIGASYGGG